MRFVLLLLFCLVSPVSQAAGFLDRLPGFGPAKPAILPPDQAFGMRVEVLDAKTLVASFRVTPGYYLYRDKTTFAIDGDAVKITRVELPKGEPKQDPNFGLLEVFHQSFQALVTLDRPAAATSIKLNVSYQGCSDQKMCYPPINKTVQLDLPDANAAPVAPAMTEAPPRELVTPLPLTPGAMPESENDKIAGLFKSGSFWLVITSFFGAGLVLAFSPCTYPMIPILSGIIVGRGHKITHAHAFLLSLAYVLGMAITYAAAGVAAGFSGELISSAMQTPWVLGSFAALLVLLSLSMFGFYELQLPSSLQSRLTDTSNHLHGGHLSGVFVMGVLSAIIVGPCVAAPLAGALLYIGQTHDAVLGGTALFSMALGMGVPLLLIGSSAGTLLPKAGAWMEAVKRFFGVLLLAMAIWMITPVIPLSIQMLLWAALLIFSGIYLRALDPLPHNAGGRHKLFKGVGLFALLLGVAYLIGALSGATDILRPLGNIGHAEAKAPATLQFTRVKDVADLDRRLAEAGGKFVMLDFYADWCVSCKEMERYTFGDAAVRNQLKPVLLLQADVTANSVADKELLKRFGLYGPPGIIFFDAQGREVSSLRVVGYQDAGQFLQTLQQLMR